ncbi:NADH:flavin oxidoreductase/NADH oxidase family protein [Umezawaea sp. Da 62-37]|uniref:NADH:flavin oxidoreductase/NADH oxidase family protein n=1 Tax=Umezawaea sp. Da 62-37 TaxID=3075927 RepID=UPI0028F70A80|nr:NADH:flavin oxidoreductase/NADH oxidase family protein [Umezawaea sp. Da 62-37]WNV86251.1 NADH:flavin oxidoreductase/NADH oxidase family protein [Umezawaea sp. Da 62-37]
MVALHDPLVLGSGSVLPNRIAKAATEENLADAGQVPGDELVALYRRWGGGGAGLLITGHVMVDARAMAQPADVVLESATDLAPFRRWATAAKAGGAEVWMQINHPGRVVQKDMAEVTWSASDVPIDAGALSSMFGRPRAMGEAEIAEVIGRFAVTAARAEAAGFDGVEIHAAHGYLISQFLSPRTNLRTDGWGGSPTGRVRFLLAVVDAVRAAVSPGFAVAVKLNSADFQRGGFDVDDAREVIRLLGGHAVDLVELSGGSIESLATSGAPSDGSTLAREAYFLEFADRLLEAATMPLMVTGGVRRRAVAQRVIDGGVAVVGVATALAMAPDLPARWLAGEEGVAPNPRARVRHKAIAAAGTQALALRQFTRLAAGDDGVTRLPATLALLVSRVRRAQAGRRYHAWLAEVQEVVPVSGGCARR